MNREDESGWALLGLDLGTSAVKAVLVDGSGRLLREAVRPYPLETPGPLAAEQDPRAWWVATAEAIGACLADGPVPPIRGVGLTGQKHALLGLDDALEPVGRAVLWCDGRATRDAEVARSRVAGLARRTGAPPVPGYLVPKWLRLKRTDPEAAGRIRHLCFAKDWLRLRLTGVLATDRTEASASQLWDVRRRTWSPELRDAFNIPVEALPPVHPSVAVTGSVTEAAAHETGLPVGVPVVAGAGDNEAAAVGCGALAPGRVAVILGTSGTVLARTNRRGRPGGLVWGDHVTRRGVGATGTVLSSGRALAWFAGIAFEGDVEALLAAAAEIRPGSAPLFLPTLAGERSPVPDPEAAGAFAELRPHHGAGHLARAVVEGVALAVGGVVHALRRSRVLVEELRLTSRGARAPLLRHLVAAAANAPLTWAGAREGPARGAALLARVAGASDAVLLEAADRWTPHSGTLMPEPDEVARLEHLAVRSEALRRALANRS